MIRFNIPSAENIQNEIKSLKQEIEMKSNIIKEAESSIKCFIHLKSGSV